MAMISLLMIMMIIIIILCCVNFSWAIVACVTAAIGGSLAVAAAPSIDASVLPQPGSRQVWQEARGVVDEEVKERRQETHSDRCHAGYWNAWHPWIKGDHCNCNFFRNDNESNVQMYKNSWSPRKFFQLMKFLYILKRVSRISAIKCLL